jgi:hypothetical protein
MTNRPIFEEMKSRVLEFAIEHKCVISPEGWIRQLEGYLEHGHCVCTKRRVQCPCTEAPLELMMKGRCLCGLFWSGYEAYWIARHFEKNLDAVAIVADTKPDVNSGDQPVTKKKDAPELFRLSKFEALLNFRDGFEEPAPPSNDYIAEAVSLLTGKAGISLEDRKADFHPRPPGKRSLPSKQMVVDKSKIMNRR